MRPKHLSLFLACLAGSVTAHAKTDTSDIASISLVSTGSYDPRTENNRFFETLFSGFGAWIAGPKTDITQSVREKLDDPALRPYFPDESERAALARSLSKGVKKRFFSNGYSNESVDGALHYLTDKVIATVVVRVLENKGVKDEKRAKAWAAKISGPYDRCASLASSFPETKKCGDLIQKDLMKNVGLALAYELPRQEFPTAKASTKTYKSCLKATRPGADARVENCALESVRSAAESTGRAQVLKAAQDAKMADGPAAKLADQATKDFHRCLAKANERSGFLDCGDELLANAGASIASARVLSDARVIKNITSLADRKQLAAAGAAAFRTCAQENHAQELRDEQGRLQTANCVDFVTLETARSVAERQIAENVVRNLPAPADQLRVGRAAIAALRACWDSKKPQAQDAACLRNVVKKVGHDVATQRVRNALPAEIPMSIATQPLTIFDTCLNAKLPANLLDKPAGPALTACQAPLEKDVAVSAATSLVPKRIDEFLAAGGGPAAFGLDPAGRQALLDGIINSGRQCLGQSSGGQAATNACLKDTVKTAALKLGDLELKRLARVNNVDMQSPALAPVAQKFRADFGACLDRNKDPRVSLEIYLKGIDGCKNEITKSTTAQVAKAELDQRVQDMHDMLGDDGTAVENTVLQNFGPCMSQSADSNASDACVTTLRADATWRLTEAALHKKVKDGDPTLDPPLYPKLLEANDRKIEACVKANSKDAEDCAVAYAKESGLAIVHASLLAHLRSDLAPPPLNFKESDLPPLAPKIAEIEQAFQQCMGVLKKPLNKAFGASSGECANTATGSIMALENSWLAAHTPPPTPAAPTQPVASAPPPAPALAAHTPSVPSVAPPPAPAAHAENASLAVLLTQATLCLNGHPDPGPLPNLPADSVEDKLLGLVDASLAYDLAGARGKLGEVMAQVADELRVAGPVAARRKLVRALGEKGLADQTLKGLLQRDLKKAIQTLPAEQQAAVSQVANRAAIDTALSPEVLSRFRLAFTLAVLSPVLAEGQPLNAPNVADAWHELRASAADALFESAHVPADVRAKLAKALEAVE